MKWYKHDPSAALAGMMGLTVEERGAYYTLIDVFYDRDGHVPDDDWLMSRILGCNPRTWRRLKLALFQKHKVTVEAGNLVPNRGRSTLIEAKEFAEHQRNRARMRWERVEKVNKNNEAAMPITTTTTTTKKEVIFPAVAGSSSTLSSSEDPLKKKGVGRPPAVFECGVIRLTQKGLDDWRVAYPHLDLEAELYGLAAWAGREPNWFPAISGALAKRNREMKVNLEQARHQSAAKEPANDLQSVLNR
jgi:uncharacterized protein YdaU (DUF1376 family)